MLKEMTVLVIVLWGSHGMPTPMPTPTSTQQQDLGELIRLYCKAEALLQDYKAAEMKFLPPQTRPSLNEMFSKPGCNFTKPAEECQILRAFHALFLWLQSTYPQEELLKPVLSSISLLIELHESHINDTCLQDAPEEVPKISCPKYRSGKPELENKFHYIFELYRNHTENLWRSKLPEKERNATDVCGIRLNRKSQLNVTK